MHQPDARIVRPKAEHKEARRRQHGDVAPGRIEGGELDSAFVVGAIGLVEDVEVVTVLGNSLVQSGEVRKWGEDGGLTRWIGCGTGSFASITTSTQTFAALKGTELFPVCSGACCAPGSEPKLLRVGVVQSTCIIKLYKYHLIIWVPF